MTYFSLFGLNYLLVATLISSSNQKTVSEKLTGKCERFL